jgi:hypothetical protein
MPPIPVRARTAHRRLRFAGLLLLALAALCASGLH